MSNFLHSFSHLILTASYKVEMIIMHKWFRGFECFAQSHEDTSDKGTGFSRMQANDFSNKSVSTTVEASGQVLIANFLNTKCLQSKVSTIIAWIFIESFEA